MKHLIIFLKDYKKETVLSPLFKLFEAVMDLLVPIIVAHMINHGIAFADRRTILLNFALLIILAAAGLGFALVAQFYAAKASVGFATQLRSHLFRHIQKLSYSQLDQIGSDTLITRMTSDVQQVQNGVNMALRLVLRSPLIVFGAMILAFTINVRTALVFVVIIPILAAVVLGIMTASIPLFRKVQAGLDHLLGLTREDLTGVRVIRAFRREQHELDRFDIANEELTKLNERVGRLSAMLNPMTYVLINIATIVLIRTGAVQVNLGNMMQGDVVALYNYMAQIIIELIKLSSLIILLNRSLACADRISNVLQLDPTLAHEPQQAPSVSDANVLIRFDDVSFSYPGSGEEALSHISFDVKKGEKIGIIGGTGSGKSTLVQLLPGFYPETVGQISFEGNRLSDYPRKDLLSKFGIVPQKAVLFAGTVRDNLKFGNPDASDEDLWQALEVAQAKEIIAGKEAGLDSKIEQGGRNLSGGQRQRLTIARALAKKPQILILDDSSSALDQATDFRLRQSLTRLPSQPTLFIVSQRISSIQSCDRILVLHDGQLVGNDSHEALLASNRIYQEIFDSQFPGMRKEAAYDNR